MAAYPAIPVPLSIEEEEAQLEYAILQSLGQLDVAALEDTLVESICIKQTRDMENDTSLQRDGSTSESNKTGTTSKAAAPAPYRRSDTEPYILSSPRSPNAPTLTKNRAQSRSFSHSLPWETYSTDCCEVREEIQLGNTEYIDKLNEDLKISNVITPIHVAVTRGHFDCLDKIIELLPDTLNSKDAKGETPLFQAISDRNIIMARRLIDAGADVNIGQRNRDTPLLAAIENDCSEATRLLLKRGANPNMGMNRGWTAIHECVYRGSTELLEELLKHGGSPNVRDRFGVSPVFSSAACGRNECLNVLLRAGGDPNLCASCKAASPLYEACKGSHEDCAITLMKHGADPHVPNCENLFPIHMACQKGLIRVVEELARITDKDLVQYCGKSPIHCAAEEDEIEIIEILVKNGYDVNVKISKDKISFRDRRQTALFFAVYNGSEEATKVLLDAGAKTDLDYVKPLLVAESHRQYDIVDMLIASGADINASFVEEGMIFPATAAFAIKDAEMLRTILLAGCDAIRCFHCPFGEVDHRAFNEGEQKKSFCHFISQDQNIAWAGWTVLRLLDFVSNVKLCLRIRNTLTDTEEWSQILDATEHPRRLTHLCRLKIRQASKNITFDRAHLPLPKPLIDYLNHKSF